MKSIRSLRFALFLVLFTVCLLPGGNSWLYAAILSPQNIIGAPSLTDEVGMDIAILNFNSTVQAGNMILTDIEAQTDLLGDDGSFLEIHEGTELSVLEYEFDSAQQIRIARFAILEGLVTADAAHLEYATNVFVIESPTVTASFKFSKLTIEVDKDGNTTLTPHSGLFEFTWTEDSQFWQRTGRRRGIATLSHRNADGVETRLNVSENSNVGIQITSSGLSIENQGDMPLQAEIGGQTVQIPEQSSLDASGGGPMPPSSAGGVPPTNAPPPPPPPTNSQGALSTFHSIHNGATSPAGGFAPVTGGPGGPEGPGGAGFGGPGNGMPNPGAGGQQRRVWLRIRIDTP